MRIAAVLPAYNVEKALRSVVESLRDKTDSIVIVNDGSRDATQEIAESLEAAVLTHIVNRGQGAALRTGTRYALDTGADIIVHFDSDGQFRVQDIEKMIAPLRSGEADVVFGSRFMDDSTKMPAFKRNVIMPIARIVNNVFFGIKTNDPQSGFRAMNREAAESIEWQHDRMAHCSEILVEAHRKNLRIKEVPVTMIYTVFGQKFSGGVKIVRDMFLALLDK